MCHVGREGSGVSHEEGGVWCDTWGGRGLVCHVGREGSSVSRGEGESEVSRVEGGVWCVT